MSKTHWKKFFKRYALDKKNLKGIPDERVRTMYLAVMLGFLLIEKDYIEEITNLRISGEYLNKLYYNRTREAIEDIRYLIKEHNENRSKKIESFEKMPKPLQIVLIDMVFNLGIDGFSWK